MKNRMNLVLENIKKRYSCRNYDNSRNINKNDLIKILEAASNAPSGKNYQPWAFYINSDMKDIEYIASNSIYYDFISKSPCIVSIYLNKDISYDYLKDSQAIGAAIQNILLAAHSLEIASCWVGEILKNKDKIEKFHNVDKQFELMAIITLGYETNCDSIKKTSRKNLDELIIDWK